MRARGWVVLVCAALLGTGTVLYLDHKGPFQDSARAERDAASLDALPRRTLAPMIEDGDLVVFQDGSDGWFELSPEALPPATEIGFHGPRLFDVLTGNTHVPTYCGGTRRPGKILWVVQDGTILRDYAYCDPRRMDLRTLRVAAAPVDMVHEDLPQAELLARIEAVAADPTRALIAVPDRVEPLTHRVVLTLPLFWRTEGFLFDWEDAVLSMIEAIAPGEVSAEFAMIPGIETWLSIESQDGTTVVAQGMGLRRDDGLSVIPGLIVEARQIRIDCLPGACAQVIAEDTLAGLAAMLDEQRDMALLDTHLANAIPDTLDRAPVYVDRFPTDAQLREAALGVSGPDAILYSLRYIHRTPPAQ